MNGWVGKVLEVDLSTGQIGARETVDYVDQYLGGRALAAGLAWDFLGGRSESERVGPYEEANPVIITTGPLTGTLSPTSGRTVMSSVSPRTRPLPWYTHSTLGGSFGPELKYAGYDAVAIRGRAAGPSCLVIQDGTARLVAAADLWGMDAWQTALALKRRLGRGTQVLTIGPAGENLSAYATVQHNEENAAGHSGFGAVWGSKKLKAIAVRGTGSVGVADPAWLLCEARAVGGAQLAPNTHAFAQFQNWGSEAKADRPVCTTSCRYNCILSNYVRVPGGRRMPTACNSMMWMGHMDATRYSGGGVEIPAGVDFDEGQSAWLIELCNNLGLDLYLRTTLHPWLVRCTELGVREIRGHPLAPASAAWFEGFLRQLAGREGLGALLADGMLPAADELEGELPEELITLARHQEFGFGFSAHREGRFLDEEPLPFWVVSAMMYAAESRDPTIGTHSGLLLLADAMLRDPDLARQQFRRLSAQVWGDPEALEPTFDHKAPLAVWAQNQHMVIDSLPLCDFAFPPVLRPLANWEEFAAADDLAGDLDLDRRLLAAVTGRDYTRAELDLIAERAINLERLLLLQAGRDRKLEDGLAWHFRLPCRADGTWIDEAGFSRLIDEFYAARGWDRERGRPLPETLARLGLASEL